MNEYIPKKSITVKLTERTEELKVINEQLDRNGNDAMFNRLLINELEHILGVE